MGGGGWGAENLEFQYFFLFFLFIIIFFLGGGGGVQKNEYVWGYGEFMDMYLESTQNWTGFRGYFCAFYGLFLRSMYSMGIYFGVAKISNIFLGYA